MDSFLYPALFAVGLWWAATGAILWLLSLRRGIHTWVLGGASLLLVAAFLGLHASAQDSGITGAYCGFTSAIAIWAWIEVTFLTGALTGPRREAAPQGARGWPRFRAAVAAILWHEIAIIAGAVAVLAATAGAPNRIGAWTFLLLALMRLSAKLNIFLGVRNLGEALLPAWLRYLESYFARRPSNALFPFSVALLATLCAWLVIQAMQATDPADAVGFTLLATLVALGLLEHGFMIAPIPPEAMWRWSIARRERDRDDVSTWQAGIAAPCDAAGLERVLGDVARGDYGQVFCLRGTLRSGSGWVRVDVEGGRAALRPFTPRGTERPGIVAIGQTLDHSRLQAAFAACALRAA